MYGGRNEKRTGRWRVGGQGQLEHVHYLWCCKDAGFYWDGNTLESLCQDWPSLSYVLKGSLLRLHWELSWEGSEGREIIDEAMEFSSSIWEWVRLQKAVKSGKALGTLGKKKPTGFPDGYMVLECSKDVGYNTCLISWKDWVAITEIGMAMVN